MREIKYRAWLKNEKRMVEWNNLHMETEKSKKAKSPIFIVWVNEDGGRDNFNGSGYAVDDVILMLYTGLKDKNGKEIYEGDILYWKDLDTFPGEVLEEVTIVFWDDEHLRWGIETVEKMKKYEKLYNYSDVEEIEVIGNIYENPELLDTRE